MCMYMGMSFVIACGTTREVQLLKVVDLMEKKGIMVTSLWSFKTQNEVGKILLVV